VNSSHPQWANTYGIYHFSETSGSFIDASGHGNTASPATARPLNVTGFFGSGVYGYPALTAEYSTTTAYNNPQVFTLMSWFKTTSTFGGVFIEFSASQTGNMNNYDRFIAMEDDGQIVFGVNGNSPWNVSVVRSPASYNDGKWHHAAASFTAGAQNLYVDGLLVDSRAALDAEPIPTGWWRIGNGKVVAWPVNLPQPQYYGALDEVAVWTAALNSTEIMTVYRSQRCGSN
jgi:hypothetical protein